MESPHFSLISQDWLILFSHNCMFCQPTLSNQFWERKSDAGCRLFCDDYQCIVLMYCGLRRGKPQHNSCFSFLDSHDKIEGLSNLHLAEIVSCQVHTHYLRNSLLLSFSEVPLLFLISSHVDVVD